MHTFNRTQWILLAALSVVLAVIAVHLTDGSSIDKDAAQNLQLAVNLSHDGVMSMEETPPLTRSMYREPLPVAVSAALIHVIDATTGRAPSADYFAGPRAQYIKYQNVFWLLLLWAGAVAATRFFSGSFWLALVAGLLAVRPFMDRLAAEGVNGLYTELPGAALMMLASFLLAAAVARKNTGLMIAGGLCFGVLTLTKAATLYVFVGMLVVLLFTYLRGNALPRQPRIVQLLLLAAAFAVVVTPWMARNYAAFGKAQVSARGGLVLYTRALMDQVTPLEYRGSFYAWARPGWQRYVGKALGFTPQDLEPGGRLQRLSGGPGTPVAKLDEPAEDAGRPQDTISFYRKARAERIRREHEMSQAGGVNPEIAADAIMQQEGMAIIKADPGANLKMILPLIWRGALTVFPLLTAALLFSLWAKRYALALFVLPCFATLCFYALITHFEPRPTAIAHATAMVSALLMLQALARRCFGSKHHEIREGEIPREGRGD